MQDLRYPIGRHTPADTYSVQRFYEQIDEIKELPSKLIAVVDPMEDYQLNTPYRSDGWSVRQLVHHIADSHMNGYIRMNWALTEDTPTIKPYDQNTWAELDLYKAPVSISLNLIDNLHQRWGYFLDSLEEEELQKRYLHPDKGPFTLWQHVDHYAWHGRHHLAHITSLIERKNW